MCLQKPKHKVMLFGAFCICVGCCCQPTLPAPMQSRNPRIIHLKKFSNLTRSLGCWDPIPLIRDLGEPRKARAQGQNGAASLLMGVKASFLRDVKIKFFTFSSYVYSSLRWYHLLSSRIHCLQRNTTKLGSICY